MVDVLQRGGRALRNSHEDALFIVLYEPWVHDISLDEYNEGDLGDPDHPRAKLKSSSQRRERAPLCMPQACEIHKMSPSSVCLLTWTTHPHPVLLDSDHS